MLFGTSKNVWGNQVPKNPENQAKILKTMCRLKAKSLEIKCAQMCNVHATGYSGWDTGT